MDKTKRQMLKLIVSLPFANKLLASQMPFIERHLGDEFVLVDGWILKKSDLDHVKQ